MQIAVSCAASLGTGNVGAAALPDLVDTEVDGLGGSAIRCSLIAWWAIGSAGVTRLQHELEQSRNITAGEA